jgi:hypothetical protein
MLKMIAMTIMMMMLMHRTGCVCANVFFRGAVVVAAGSCVVSSVG